MKNQKNLAVAMALGHWMLAGLTIGLVVSAVICYSRPKMFTTAALLAAKEQAGRTVELAPIHAAQVIRLTGDQIHWEKPLAESISELCKNTRITARKNGIEIVVERTNKVEARDIALEIAWLFRGMDAEETLAACPVDLPPLTEMDKIMTDDRRKVEKLLENEVRENGWIPAAFRIVPSLARQGSPEASALWQSETFQLHWNFLENLHEKLAAGPPLASPTLPLLLLPEIPNKVSSPQVELYLYTGLIIGLIIGTFIGFRQTRALISSGGNSNIPEETDGVRSGKPNTIPFGRPSTPEEEW